MSKRKIVYLLQRSFLSLAVCSFFTITMSAQHKAGVSAVQLVTLNPGHFHAALVQKSMYPSIDSTVYVYAPQGRELDAHLALINGYNNATGNATAWKEVVYTGDDYLKKMLAGKKGNLVVIAGNNQLKTNYISLSIGAGLNVLADKPMAIDRQGFSLLEQSFAAAQKKKLLLYDIMTERFQATNALQRELSMLSSVFGTLLKGTVDDPAIIKESVHHFFKTVSGKPLVRPAWYFDTKQEGEGIVDVTTHLVDLVQWECFPGISLNYKEDIHIEQAKRWATAISAVQFKQSTQLDTYPGYLSPYIKDDTLHVYANGSFDYTIKGVHARIAVTWNFEAPVGGGDTHYSIMKGTKASLVIRQGAAQQYKPILYIEPVDNNAGYEQLLRDAIAKLAIKYEGLSLQQTEKGWALIIPAKYELSHEACFAEVMKRYLSYLQQGSLPAWEVPNMLAKYYTTVSALAAASIKK